MAQEKVEFQGLPSRICWLGYGERAKFGLKLNEMVRNGELKAPIVIGRDHLDCGSVASPNRETEAMLDLAKGFPQGERMLELYREYEAGETAEARFLKLCDKLDMAFQSYVYQSRTENDLSNFRITANRLVVEYGYPDLLDGSIE